MSEDRKLATVARVLSVSDIENAHSLQKARVRGWDVIVKKGEFSAGDLGVYFEVDSALPLDDERFAFLKGRRDRVLDDGRSVHVLRTMKLRGELSQGLLLPVSAFPELHDTDAFEGDDVSELLSITKYEPKFGEQKRSPNLAIAYGGLPQGIPRTSCERVQNLEASFWEDEDPRDWVATEKIDGTSCTFYFDVTAGPGRSFGVCSRNLDLRPDTGSKHWEYARKHQLDYRLLELLRDFNSHQFARAWSHTRIAVQGELYGNAIGGSRMNPLQLPDTRFSVFNVMLDDAPVHRQYWDGWLKDNAVPMLELRFPHTVDEALAQVDARRSALNPDRLAEGVVWEYEPIAGRAKKFKVISNAYLLKEKS